MGDSKDDSDWTVQKSASHLLTKVASLVKDGVWKKTMEFIQTRIDSANWLDNQMALCALGSSVEGPDIGTIQEDLANMMDMILQKLTESPVAKLRYTVCWLM